MQKAPRVCATTHLSAKPFSSDSRRCSFVIATQHSRCRPRLSHGKEIELITIRISKITRVEALAPRAGRAFILGTELQGLTMQCVNLGGAIDVSNHGIPLFLAADIVS